jgi:hypothetical protein
MKLVAFSGLDGSGKSTQIELLEDYLREQGQRVNILTMYDDVSISGMSRRWLRGKRKKTKPSPAATVRPVVKSEPSFRLDKNYFSWPRFLGRLLVYSADALVLRMRVSRLRAECDWLICDRFIYDSLVNLFAPEFRVAAPIQPRGDASRAGARCCVLSRCRSGRRVCAQARIRSRIYAAPRRKLRPIHGSGARAAAPRSRPWRRAGNVSRSKGKGQ